jgi:hypothetical protein
VQAATIDGRPLGASWFLASRVRPKATLRLVMGAQPAPGGAGLLRPPSASDSPLASFGCRPA